MTIAKINGKWHITFCGGKFEPSHTPKTSKLIGSFCDKFGRCLLCPFHSKFHLNKTYGKFEDTAVSEKEMVATYNDWLSFKSSGNKSISDKDYRDDIWADFESSIEG